jgi:polynucleotide 5'-kinase involved in rRNA processing
VTGTTKAHFVAPDSYNHLMCAFARPDGEEIGVGLIERIDWDARIVHAQCTAVPPVPVRILRVGALRVDLNGRELGEVKPWHV